MDNPKIKNEKEIVGRTKNFIMKLSIIAGIVILFFVFYKLSKVIYQQRATDDEIASLQKEIDRLGKNNQNMEELVNYFQTDEFKEKEAKDKLNLVKDGEQVVFLKEKEILEEEKTPQPKPEVTISRPNYYYWWYYFFKI